MDAEVLPEKHTAHRRPRRALLLVNRASRRGGASVQAALDGLEAAGITLHFEQPATREDISRIINARADELDCVIVGGGDGTLNAAAPALLQTGLPLGILPLGTANDLARTLGLPSDLRAAAAVIAAGDSRRIDVGLVNGHPFLNVASLGLSTDLAARLTGQGKRRLGRLSYPWAALQVLTKARPFRAMILSKEGATRVRTFQITVGNGRYYGGGIPVRHDARIDDGRLDLSSLELPGIWSLMLMAPAFRQGTHGAWREVRDQGCIRFEVRTRRPRPVNLDGELLTLTPARFELLPGALQVYAPSIKPGGITPPPVQIS